MAKALIVALIVLFSADQAAAFRWPWELPRRVHRSHHFPKPAPQPAAAADQPASEPEQEPVDCDAIKAAAKRMTAAAFQKALRLSDDHQKKIIGQCLKGQ